MIAPCGMDCALCYGFQVGQYDLNHKGFHNKSCLGCRSEGHQCKHFKPDCPIKTQSVSFCFECPDYPCPALKSLDYRYRQKNHMSLLENLKMIQKEGLDAFVTSQDQKWTCEKCGALRCCHKSLCLNCELDLLQKKRSINKKVQ
ncbi:MAG: DUF3795 domain-containing protein [Erysipelotrichaceae bacterium]|jgi:hypothetical protein|nr:DUF3795 domain-containing protein [Erysipelotrichaceae bacterium]